MKLKFKEMSMTASCYIAPIEIDPILDMFKERAKTSAYETISLILKLQSKDKITEEYRDFLIKKVLEVIIEKEAPIFVKKPSTKKITKKTI